MNRFVRHGLVPILSVLLVAVPARRASSTTITVVNLDGAGEGLNDNTPLAPVGGNTGTTRGAQRLQAIQYAANQWAQLLGSSVEIKVGVNFDPLTCSATSAILGQAGASTLHLNFTGAPRANTLYPAALANKLAGFDLNPAGNDIAATFNSSVGTTCALPTSWYYGFDANPPGNATDFITVALHELAHGLGFATFVDETTGAKLSGYDDVFMTYLEDHSTGLLFPPMTDAQRTAACIDTGDLHWVGPAGVGGSGFLTSGRNAAGHIEMYAPNPVQPGSSVSHFSTSLFPNQILEPNYYGADHDVTLTLAVLSDLGWSNCGDGVIGPGEQCDDGNTVSGDCCSSACRFESSSTVCRAATDLCDQAETCTGSSATCPADLRKTAGTSCTDDGNPCTTDQCDGVSVACQHAAGNAGATCRAPADVCDQAETCTGLSASCPADVKVSAGTACTSDANPCTLDQCDGSNNACQHPAGNAGTVCRVAAGVCDIAELCTGLSTSCPANGFAGSAVECRASAGPCDAAEHCTGASANCPADAKSPSTTVCRAAVDVCDAAEQCDGVSNGCPADAMRPSSTVCRAAAGVCDQAESCTGSSAACPPDSKRTTQCRAPAGVCDVAESCDGVADTCPPDTFQPTTVQCRAAAGVCDAAEFCSGSGTSCPADVKLPTTSVCRAAAGLCDVAESCDGISAACPADVLVPSGAVCRPSTDPCDLPEACTGSSPACPADTNKPDSDGDGICDALDVCPGTYDPAQVDTDGDGLGDLCDPCTSPAVVMNPKVTITNLKTPPGDEKLIATGEMMQTFPFNPSLDPIHKGVRLLLTAGATTMLDVTLPAGAYDSVALHGWKLNRKHTTWTFVNPIGVNGIVRVALTTPTKFPGLVRYRVVGKHGNFTPPSVPVALNVVLDPPTAMTGQCGEATFPGPAPVPSCAYNAKHTVLGCYARKP